MSYSLNALQRLYRDYIGNIIRVIKRDTRSLGYSSYPLCLISKMSGQGAEALPAATGFVSPCRPPQRETRVRVRFKPLGRGFEAYLEGQGNVVSRLKTALAHIVTLIIPIIKLLTKSP